MKDIRQSNLNLLIIAALVLREGGKVMVTQADIDEVAYMTLKENAYEGGIDLWLEQPKRNS